MAEERVINRLRRGEKIKCPVCNNGYFDVSGDNISTSNYFHCTNPNCKGCVHEQKAINID